MVFYGNFAAIADLEFFVLMWFFASFMALDVPSVAQ
jgi:hypothetical protein